MHSELIPAALQVVFNAAGTIVADILPNDEPGPRRLTLALLEDQAGRLQVIFPLSSLLDIDQLNKALRRKLTPVVLADAQHLVQRLHLVDLPEVPALTGLETVIDQSIKDWNDVVIGAGDGMRALRLSQAAFQQLSPAAQWLSVAVPIADIDINRDHPEEDLSQLNHALSRFTSLRIQQRLEDTLELPPLPETAQRIIHLRVDPYADVATLADIVECDPSLAAQVVSWASSSFYAAPGRVRSVHDAIVRVLGFDLVMNLSMGLALGKTLQPPKDAPDGYLSYWQQSIWLAQATGLVTGLVARDRRPAFGLAYLSGLLHNFGYLVLAHLFPPHFSLICRFVEANRHVDTAFCEQHLIGITREQIGSQLMDVWAMPPEVVTALRHQKNPDYDGPHADYAQVLFLARQLLIRRGIGLGAPQAIPDRLIAALGLDMNKVNAEFDKLVEADEDIKQMAGLMSGG